MIGYKGVILYHGILKSKYKQAFELGIAAPMLQVDDGFAFSEAGYSFCGTMEEVLYHMNYLNVATNNAMQDTRLFEIETSGQVVGGSYHYKAESITLKREILAPEIVDYFKKKQFDGKLGEIVSESLPNYLEHPPVPYKEYESVEEIEKIMVTSCLRLGQKDLCMQDPPKWDFDICKSCLGYAWLGDPGSYEEDYHYLCEKLKRKCNGD